MIFLCPASLLASFRLLCFLSPASPVLWLSTHAVQLTVPIGDDGQLTSIARQWPARRASDRPYRRRRPADVRWLGRPMA